MLDFPADHRLHKPGVVGSSPTAASFEIDHAPAEEYHRRPEPSCSNLKLLRESPLAFYHRVIARTAPPYTSDALSYGTLLHTWAEIGEAEFWPRVVRPADTLVTATGALNAKGKEWAASLGADQIVLCPADEKKLRPQTQRLLDNDAVAAILAERIDAEFNIGWTWNGHRCRARVDGATPSFFFDWKTTSDPYPDDSWHRSVLKFGYHLQSAMYQSAGMAAGWPNERMRFIVTSTVWPHECCVRYLPHQVIERGRVECLRLLDELRTRTEYGFWDRANAHEEGELYFPAYAMRGEG